MSFCLEAPVLMGLEGICADELRRGGFADVEARNGSVLFSGDLREAFRANLWVRTAERVRIRIAQFRAESFTELFDGVRNAPLEEVIDRNGAFPVKGHSVRSQLTSIPDCQKIIKKAAAERLREKWHVAGMMPETGNRYQLSFTLLNNVCSLYIDTSGEGLHKRGYRAESNLAPIRETLAAGMVFLSRRRGDRPLLDPFCGSGTIVIEAALLAGNRAPGLRRNFAVERFAGFSAADAAALRKEALEEIRPFEGPIFGSDIDPMAVALTKGNAEKAGVGGLITVTKADVAVAPFPESGIVITNPPYGQRLGDQEQARNLYRTLGQRVMTAHLGAYVVTPDEKFETYYGRRADKKRKLYNGMIPCNVMMYR